jgi:hypothetical protein
MRKLLLFLGMAISGVGQPTPPAVSYVTSDPIPGSLCVVGSSQLYNYLNGNLWSCAGTYICPSCPLVPGPPTVYAPGTVRMVHDSNGNWILYSPTGVAIPITGDICQGLQTAINYPQTTGPYPIVVDGGGYKYNESSPLSQINCTSTLVFPTMHGNTFDFYGINLNLNPGNGHDGMTFDSADFSRVDFHESQIGYQANQWAIHFNPIHDNGEGAFGITVSQYNFGTIVSNSSGTPAGLVRFTDGPTASNGIGLNKFIFQEINGAPGSPAGTIGMQIDNPDSAAGFFEDNVIDANIHVVHVGLQVGTSSGALNKIFGNRFDVRVFADNVGDAGIDCWGGRPVAGLGNLFTVTGGINEGGQKLIMESSSGYNTIICPVCQPSSNTLVDSGTLNKWIMSIDPGVSSRGIAQKQTTCSVSPCIVQNNNFDRYAKAIVSNNASNITSIDISADGSGYFTFPSNIATQNTFMLLPNEYIRVIYGAGAAPVITLWIH